MSLPTHCAQCDKPLPRGWVKARSITTYNVAGAGVVALCSSKCEQKWTEARSGTGAKA